MPLWYFFDKYDILRIPFSELYKRDVPTFLSEEKNRPFYPTAA